MRNVAPWLCASDIRHPPSLKGAEGRVAAGAVPVALLRIWAQTRTKSRKGSLEVWGQTSALDGFRHQNAGLFRDLTPHALMAASMAHKGRFDPKSQILDIPAPPLQRSFGLGSKEQTQPCFSVTRSMM